MIGSRDHNGIHVVTRDDFPPIRGRGTGEFVAATLSCGRHRRVQKRRVDVAEDNRLRVCLAQKHVQIAADSVAAESDEAHGEPLTGRHTACRASADEVIT